MPSSWSMPGMAFRSGWDPEPRTPPSGPPEPPSSSNGCGDCRRNSQPFEELRSEEHTSELQSHLNLVCRLLLEKKKKHVRATITPQTLIPTSVRICPWTCRNPT